jgi:hypothetical protein
MRTTCFIFEAFSPTEKKKYTLQPATYEFCAATSLPRKLSLDFSLHKIRGMEMNVKNTHQQNQQNQQFSGGVKKK